MKLGLGYRVVVGALWIAACTVNTTDDDEDGEGTGGKESTGGTPQGEGGAPGSEAGAAGQSSPSNGGTDEGGSGQAGAEGSEPSPSGGAGVGGTGEGGAATDAGSSSQPSAGAPSQTPGGTTWPDDGRGTAGPLVLEVTTARSPAIPKQPLLWTITVGNASDKAVADVNVLFRVPDGMSFYYSTHADPDSSACGNYWCEASEEATWSLGTLPARGTQTIDISAQVLDTVGPGDDLRASIRLSATGINPLNITKSVPVGGTPGARLSLAASRDPVTPGESVLLDLEIGQVSDTSLYEGQLKAMLPPELVVDSISDQGAVDGDGAIVWPIGDIPVGSSFKRSIWATVDENAVPGDVLNPRASLTYEDAEEEPAAALPISIVEEAPPLSLTVSTTSSPAIPSAFVRYTVTVANTSQRAVENIQLLERLPLGHLFYYSTHAEPDSSACGNYWCEGNEEATWDIGDLPAGTSQTVSILSQVEPAAAGDGTLLSSSFRVRAAGVNPIQAFELVPVDSAASAQLVLGTATDPILPGQTFTYDLDIGHVGAATLNGLKLRAVLPPGVSIDSISDGGDDSGSEIEWDLGSLSVGGHAHRSVTVTASDGLIGGQVLPAAAYLTHEEGAELDASAEYAINVIEEPLPLSVVVDATPSPVAPGDRVLYTTTVTNDSERAVDGIKLMMRLPPGEQFYYSTHADPDSSSCGNYWCEGNEEAFWTIGTLPAGGLQTVTVDAEVVTTTLGGSLLVTAQRLTATNLGGTINLQTNVPTEN
jgi:uncharacterized repeat protein (TIGR01451 family)